MRRLALAVTLCAAAAVMPSAQAAPTPQLTDPKGDYPVAAADVVSALFTTEKKTKIVVTLEYAAAVNTPIPYSYQLQFTAGDYDWRGNYFGADNSTSGGCRGSDSDAPSTVKVDGNKLIFTMAAKGKLKPGTTITGINVNSHPGGVLSGGTGTVLGDSGTTDTTYTVGK